MMFGDYYLKGQILNKQNRHYFQPKTRGRRKKNHKFVKFLLYTRCYNWQFICIISFNADTHKKGKVSHHYLHCKSEEYRIQKENVTQLKVKRDIEMGFPVSPKDGILFIYFCEKRNCL